MDVPPVEAPVAFVFFGDAGTGTPAQREVAVAVKRWCEAHRCDFVALLGDNFYPDGVRGPDDPQWDTKFSVPYAEVDLPFRVALGNHDHLGDYESEVGHPTPKWELPARYYGFRAGTVDFFVLDTDAFDGPQRRWLARALDASDAPWRIVYGHHPIRSHGRHGDNRVLQRRLLPLLGDVDLYLAGHDHDKQVLAGEPLLVIAGTGGAPPRPVGSGADTLYSGNTLGFGWLSVTGDVAELAIVGVTGQVEYHRTWSR